MTERLGRYRLAGVAGGLLLAAGNFRGPLCLLQLGAFVPVMLLAMRDGRPRWAALAGLYMGIAFAIPQMLYLRMPVPVTAALLFWFTLWLIFLCALAAVFAGGRAIRGSAAFGAVWYLADWLGYTIVPIWGMAQSFARSWTAYPLLIGFISITGISGVLFVIGMMQMLAAHIIADSKCRRRSAYVLAGLFVLVIGIDRMVMLPQDSKCIRVAAAGWIFDDINKTHDPHTPQGFQQLFAEPAQKAAAQGARIFTTGEMGFYIANHDYGEWMNRFAEVARKNNLWLVVGYFHITADENRIFFMNPQGAVEAEYTKTYLTPFEPGKKGSGDLKTVDVDGVKVGAMICQDDNFGRLTRRYGWNKASLVLCPTADWWTIKDAHLQAVRARAIECRYAMARGAANGISAIISPTGKVLAKMDHYRSGPGVVIADVPVHENITPFARLGHAPMIILAAVILLLYAARQYKFHANR